MTKSFTATTEKLRPTVLEQSVQNKEDAKTAAKNVKNVKNTKSTKGDIDIKDVIEKTTESLENKLQDKTQERINFLKVKLTEFDKGTGAGALAALDTMEQIQQLDKKIKHKNLKDRYKPEYERVNLKIPVPYVEYLRAAAARESDSRHLMNLTDIICKIIQEDMKKHK